MEHFNQGFDSVSDYLIPNGAGDRYYAQDLALDFRYLQSVPGRIGQAFAGKNLLLQKGTIAEGADQTHINIGVFSGVVQWNTTGEDPNTPWAIPPATREMSAAVFVENEPVVNVAVPDGTSYLKLKYKETPTGVSRQKQFLSGTYQPFTKDSFEWVVNTSEPASLEIKVATITTGDQIAVVYEETVWEELSRYQAITPLNKQVPGDYRPYSFTSECFSADIGAAFEEGILLTYAYGSGHATQTAISYNPHTPSMIRVSLNADTWADWETVGISVNPAIVRQPSEYLPQSITSEYFTTDIWGIEIERGISMVWKGTANCFQMINPLVVTKNPMFRNSINGMWGVWRTFTTQDDMDVLIATISQQFSEVWAELAAFQGATIYIGIISQYTKNVTPELLTARSMAIKGDVRAGYVLEDLGDENTHKQFHYWRYQADRTWYDMGEREEINTATNTNLGLVKGTTENLGVSVNAAGEMSVNGLTNAIATAKSEAISSAASDATTKANAAETNAKNASVPRTWIITTEPSSASTDSQVTSSKRLWTMFGAALSTLTTTAKTVVGAINELVTSIATKQPKLTATGATNLLLAPASAGGQPTTKPVADFATAAEVTKKLSGKSDTSHTHDDIYYARNYWGKMSSATQKDFFEKLEPIIPVGKCLKVCGGGNLNGSVVIFSFIERLNNDTVQINGYPTAGGDKLFLKNCSRTDTSKAMDNFYFCW
jgi:hypothetical protein